MYSEATKQGFIGGGAALLAVRRFGAIYGQGVGLQGQSYALPTKDKRIETLPLFVIKQYVDQFFTFAKENKHLIFLMTKIGCGLAGYDVQDIAPLFIDKDIPSNVILPIEFSQL